MNLVELRRGEVNLIGLKRANLIELREFDKAKKKRCKKEGKDRRERWESDLKESLIEV